MIKFRGFRKDGKGWVEGYYLFRFNSHRIQTIDENYLNGGATLIHEIHPESLAMSTGLIDKNGKEIFGSIEVDGVMSKGGSVVKSDFSNTAANVLFGNFNVQANDEHFNCVGFYFESATEISEFGKTIHGNTDAYEIIGNQYQQ